MTTFTNGPAAGQHLSLKRAPKYLRVVCADGKWDALDQPEDAPREKESVHAYRVVGKPSMCHVRKSGGGSGFYALATYEHVAEQPSDAVMRDSVEWCRWCNEQEAF